MGRGSDCAKPEESRRKVLQLIRKKYSGTDQERFGPTLAVATWTKRAELLRTQRATDGVALMYTTIGAYDFLIAAQAVRNKLTLVTANISEFARIEDQVWADWGKP